MFSITHSDNTVDGVTLHSAGWILQPASPDKVGGVNTLTNKMTALTILTNQEFPPPELFSHCLVSGHKLYGMIYKPHNAVPGVR